MRKGGGEMEEGGGKCVFVWVLGMYQGREDSEEPGEKKDKKKDKLLLAPLFLHPSDVPFPLVVWKTLTLTPSHTHSITPLSAIVPIPVSPDLLHTPLHMDKWLGLTWPGPNDPQLREEWG